MSGYAKPVATHAQDVPDSMKQVLLLMSSRACMTMVELRAAVGPNAPRLVDRMVGNGLLECVHREGTRQWDYTLSPKGRRFAQPTSGVRALPRTIPFGGTYAGDPWPQARAGQHDFLYVPSVGLAT